VKTKLCVLAVAALVIWGMKLHYAGARADDLWWILTPTTRVVGAITGTTFVVVPSEGHVSYKRRFVIEKSCAGINFMAAAFGMLVFSQLHRAGSGRSGLRVLGASLLASYGAAIFVNAARIAIAMWLADRPFALSTFTPAEIHRLEGIMVYFAGLVLLCELARRIDSRTRLAGRLASRSSVQRVMSEGWMS
jgi:exosortase K